jgi:catechol 2,3-dioxygenase-like lactoylglutathione lyase family enzyme
MSNNGLRHLALRSRDLKETEHFYTKVLGLRIAFRVPPGMLFFRTPGGNDLLNFVKTTKKIPADQSLHHFGFKVTRSALKKMEKRLRDHGVEIEDRRGKTAIYFSDPNGYCIEFYCD